MSETCSPVCPDELKLTALFRAPSQPDPEVIGFCRGTAGVRTDCCSIVVDARDRGRLRQDDGRFLAMREDAESRWVAWIANVDAPEEQAGVSLGQLETCLCVVYDELADTLGPAIRKSLQIGGEPGAMTV